MTEPWTLVQQQFVDQLGNAVAEADRLVTMVMGERGYPTEGYRQQVSELSVRHGATLDHYRSAHAIKARNDDRQAVTEELREAMVHTGRCSRTCSTPMWTADPATPGAEENRHAPPSKDGTMTSA